MSTVTLANRHGVGLTITVCGRQHPEHHDFWDGNWLISPIEVRLGGLTAVVHANLRANELDEFRDQLRRLCETGGGTAVFASLEDWLDLAVHADETVHGEVRTDPAMGANVAFRFDGADLPAALADLDACVAEHPVLGLAR